MNLDPGVAATTTKKEREVFVAYPYRLYPADDYRAPFINIARAFQVQFTFADEQFSASYLLEKITAMIRASQFGIYDITGWNANVSLEVGLALGLNEKAYIAFNPTKTDLTEVPSDLRGRDRIEYQSYNEFESKLARLITGTFPIPVSPPTTQFDELQSKIMNVLRVDAGLYVGDIASVIGVKPQLTRFLLQELMNDNRVRTDGSRRGMRYFKV